MKKLLIIDTFNFIHRAYHALPKSFTDPNGEPINAVYGITSMLLNTLDLIKPDYAVAAMDSKEPTFRVEEFTGYKAHRKPMEDDLESQIPKVIEVIDSFGIKLVQANGYEADDIIGTLSKNYKDKLEIIIVSNDRDMWQLAEKNVVILVPSNKQSFEWIGHNEAKIRLEFDPKLLPDYKGLRGDPSDNIPGVYGIGDKTAKDLVKKYGSIENIFTHISQIEPNSLKEKLANNYEIALQSKRLGEIVVDVPFLIDLESCKYSVFNKLEVKKVLEKYNFKSLIKRLGFDTQDGSLDNRKDAKKEVPENQLPLL